MSEEPTRKQRRALIIEETNRIIAEYTTRLTIRQIYYRLVSKHIIHNTVSQYKYLDGLLVDARWNGQVKFSAIEDRTRAFLGGDEDLETPQECFDKWYGAFKNCYSYFDLPRWKDQEYYIEVWLEKQALQGLFQQVTEDLKVTLFPCRGYPSLTKLYEAAGRLIQEGGNKQVKILYFGDFDPSGEDILRQIQKDLTKFGVNFEFEKIAILKEQIDEYEIPPFPAKTSDPRYEGFVAEHGDEAVELDAIDPKILQNIIRESVGSYFDEDTYSEIQGEEEEGREAISGMISEALKAEPEKREPKAKKKRRRK